MNTLTFMPRSPVAAAGLLSALGALVAGAAAARAGDWPSYGGDDANTRRAADESAITAETVADLAPVWRIDGTDGMTSTPVVREGVVYFGDWKGRLHAVRLADGSTVWTQKLAKRITASALVTDVAVYIADAEGFLHARARADGAELWKKRLDEHPATDIFSSPVLVDGAVIIGVASHELMIPKRDFTFVGSVVALDAGSGELRWRLHTTRNDDTAGAGVSVWSSAAVDRARGLVFIGTGNTYEKPPSKLADGLLAIRAATGELVWSRQFTEGDVFNILKPQGPDADVGGTPNLFRVGERDVVGVGDKAGHYRVCDRETGEIVWDAELTRGSHLGGVMVSAATTDELVLVSSNVWKAVGQFGDASNTAVTFALDKEDGSVRWKREIPAPVFGALCVAGGVVYHGSIDGKVWALDARDGAVLWTDEPGGDIASGFSVVDGKLLVGHGYWFFTAPPVRKGGLVAYAVKQGD